MDQPEPVRAVSCSVIPHCCRLVGEEYRDAGRATAKSISSLPVGPCTKEEEKMRGLYSLSLLLTHKLSFSAKQKQTTVYEV